MRSMKEMLKTMGEIKAGNDAAVQAWKDNSIRGVLVDVRHSDVRDTRIEKSLKSYYHAIDCECIDMPMRYISGKPYVVICDDEGLFANNPRVSAVSNNGNVELVGNLFIVKFDGQDDVRSLTDEEVAHVMRNIAWLYMDGVCWPVVNVGPFAD